MTNFKIVVEQHDDGYVAYPLGINGVVIGEGETYGAVLADVQSAIRFHIGSFGKQALDNDSASPKEFLAEADVEV